MRIRSFLFAVPFLCAAMVPPRQADACGGCFVQQTENTQVTGHRMILSVSQTQTTLYDQITYSGAPEDFAWVLPIRGQVDVALSSDALFTVMEENTRVDVLSPQISCPPQTCPDDDFDGGPSGGGSSAGEGGGGSGVEVIAQEVVGPYETVQLSSQDPAALTDWLTSRGFNVPDEIQPIIDAYVEDGFDFLALRLVPGEGIDSMRPVAVTTPGAGAALPLKMVAAGTGAITPIALWVVGEGRYEPQNFPSFLIETNELVWDWDEQKSNYSDLRQSKFTASGGAGWHLEAGEPFGSWAFDGLLYTAEYDPLNSGYADDNGENAYENAQADIDRLMTGIDPASAWVSRMSAELVRRALADDLTLKASRDQSVVVRTHFVENTTGSEPECPPPPVCDGDGSGGRSEASPWSPNDPDAFGGGGGGGCATAATPGAGAGIAAGAIALLAAAGAVRRRRRPYSQR